MRHGIAGQPAPEFRIPEVLDAAGAPAPPLTRDSLGSGYRLLYCFQHWCRGCHLSGFPTLAQVLQRTRELELPLAVAAVQTVFEGFAENSFEAMRATQQRYRLGVPFAHDPGGGSEVHPSQILVRYRTGGTPWFVLIDPANIVVHDDYWLDPDDVVARLRGDGAR